jgi:4a-hydroxytetrahydrobiopterin dehydratase
MLFPFVSAQLFFISQVPERVKHSKLTLGLLVDFPNHKSQIHSPKSFRRLQQTLTLCTCGLAKIALLTSLGDVAKRTDEAQRDNESMRRFSGPELKDALSSLTGWDVVDGKLHKEYKFADFIHAFGFMATAALAIEKMGHHPEWFNVYNRVTVDLTTHDAQGITSKDAELAKVLDEIAGKLQ